ncbi:hypothetical protein PB72LOC_04002 [Pectobacterium atrosepticum]|nr:hypothetical protein PB72LOC_04002 [Pectobacterium atrosepticum]
MSRIGGGDIACGITGRDRGTDIAIGGQHRTRHIHTPGFAIHIHRGLVALSTDGNRHRITGFDVVINLTGNGDGLTGFTGINHVIRRDVINSNRRGGCHRIDAVSVSSVCCGDIACGIARGDRRTHITVRRQHRTRHIHAPGFTVGIHRSLVGLGTDSNSDRIAGFDVVVNVTGHRNRPARFAGVNHVIRRHIINGNRRRWRNGIDTVSVSGVRRGGVACRIAGRHGRTHITIGGQHRSRYVDAPGLAVGIHCRLVGLGTDFYRNCITGFDVVINLTGHRDGLTRLAGINDVVGRHIVDRDRRHWRHRIDAVSVTGIRRGHVARRIARGDRGTDITIRCQHRTRYIDAPGLAIGIHRGLVGLGADGNRHRITGFHIVIDLTGDCDGLPRFTGIDHVIRRDVINSNRRGGCNSIDAVSVSSVCRGDIACGITGRHRGRDIAIGR